MCEWVWVETFLWKREIREHTYRKRSLFFLFFSLASDLVSPPRTSTREEILLKYSQISNIKCRYFFFLFDFRSSASQVNQSINVHSSYIIYLNNKYKVPLFYPLSSSATTRNWKLCKNYLKKKTHAIRGFDTARSIAAALYYNSVIASPTSSLCRSSLIRRGSGLIHIGEERKGNTLWNNPIAKLPHHMLYSLVFFFWTACVSIVSFIRHDYSDPPLSRWS